MAGLATARAAGRIGGRRPKLTDRQIETARKMLDSGEHTISAIAEFLGVARSTLYRALDAPTSGISTGGDYSTSDLDAKRGALRKHDLR